MRITMPLFSAFINYMVSVSMFIDWTVKDISGLELHAIIVDIIFIMIPALIGSKSLAVAITRIKESV